MNLSLLTFAIASVIFFGCASYRLPPAPMNHPANPQAMAAPLPSLSKTLGYSRADASLVRPSAAAQGGHDSRYAPADAGRQKTAVGEGKVIATVPSANQIVVEHGEIKGFMDAMTMGYRVEAPSLMDGLKPGDQVRFTIDVPNKTIVKIEIMK
jgi:Cu/Ag efflux protein CusF